MARPNPWFSPPALQYVARFSPAFFNPPEVAENPGPCFFNPPRRKLWIRGVEPSWHAPAGLFSEGSAEEIADEILEAHDYDLASSMQSLQFYINRAGRNLGRLRVLNRAKQIIRQEGISRAEQRAPRPMRAAANPAFFPYYPNPPSHEDEESVCPDCGEEFCICEDVSLECPQCEGPGMLLGRLGGRTHYRCRNCGWDFSQTGENPLHCSGYEFSCDEGSDGVLSYRAPDVERHAREPSFLPRPVREYMDNPVRRNATCFACMSTSCPCGCQGDESLCVCPNPLSWDEAQSTLEHVDKYRRRAREEDPDWGLYYTGAARGALRPLKYGHPALYEMEKRAQQKFEREIFRAPAGSAAANPLDDTEVGQIMSGVRSHHARSRSEEDPVQSAYYGGRAYEGRRIADRYGSVPWSASGRAAANPRTCGSCERGDHDRCEGCLCWCSATGFYPALRNPWWSEPSEDTVWFCRECRAGQHLSCLGPGCNCGCVSQNPFAVVPVEAIMNPRRPKYFTMKPQIEEGAAFPSRPFSHGQLRRTMETDRMHQSRMKGIIRWVAKKEFGANLSDASIEAMLGRSRAQLAEEGRHRLSKIKARADQIFYAQSRKFYGLPGTEISEETVPEPARGRRVRIVKVKRKKKAGAKKRKKVG